MVAPWAGSSSRPGRWHAGVMFVAMLLVLAVMFSLVGTTFPGGGPASVVPPIPPCGRTRQGVFHAQEAPRYCDRRGRLSHYIPFRVRFPVKTRGEGPGYGEHVGQSGVDGRWAGAENPFYSLRGGRLGRLVGFGYLAEIVSGVLVEGRLVLLPLVRNPMSNMAAREARSP